ncbi:peptide deformylase [Spirochaeta lutea]|uniref:Peptide deformylase n=1 Tax=Spirochaeta lutea TaxID=1480694 RepID=A0A098QW42_9SPIO|nr:peptide deformylase [Spirochaeta lutea]KGE70722.1 peptide deformylase [Spirochaeta lutea]
MLDLVTLPDDRLHEVSNPVANIDGTLEKLVHDMIETMQLSKGIGLAGVQIGRMDRLFVVGVPDDKPRAFINPIITARSSELSDYEEGCLSIPGVYADVTRPESVQVTAWDEQGREFSLEASGLLARVIQHEYDHLDGTLFYEYLRPGSQKRLLRLYEKRMRA